MAGLVAKIVPGGSASASEVVDNFDALRDEVNALKDANFETGAINSRHIGVPGFKASAVVGAKNYARSSFGPAAIGASFGDLDTLSSFGNKVPLVPAPFPIAPVFCTAVFDVWDTNAIPDTGLWRNLGIGTRFEFKLEYQLDDSYASATGWHPFPDASSERWITPGSGSTAPERKQVVLFAAIVPPGGYRTFNFKLLGRCVKNTASGSPDLTLGLATGELRALYAIR